MGWGLIWGLFTSYQIRCIIFGCPRSPRITKALEIFDLTLVDCWANLYRSQDDIKSWHHDNYQDWTPRPPIYKRFFFWLRWLFCFFLLGGKILGEKTWRGMEGVPWMYDVFTYWWSFMFFLWQWPPWFSSWVLRMHVHPQMVRSAQFRLIPHCGRSLRLWV